MTYRPLGPRIVSYVAVACMVVLFTVMGFALPQEVRDTVTVSQLATLGVVVLGGFAVLHGIGRTKVETDADGVHICNGYRHHDLAWAQVVGAEFGRGAPWAAIDTSDGSTVMVMAIQGADGTRAQGAFARLRSEIADHEPTRDPGLS